MLLLVPAGKEPSRGFISAHLPTHATLISEDLQRASEQRSTCVPAASRQDGLLSRAGRCKGTAVTESHSLASLPVHPAHSVPTLQTPLQGTPWERCSRGARGASGPRSSRLPPQRPLLPAKCSALCLTPPRPSRSRRNERRWGTLSHLYDAKVSLQKGVTSGEGEQLSLQRSVLDQAFQDAAHSPVMTDPSDPGPLPKYWYSVKLKLPELSSPMD